MGKTKEPKNAKKNKEKSTFGDIVFRILIILCIFLIAVLFYALYIGK